MARNGWSVVRFWHIDVLTRRTEVLDTIVAALDGRLKDRSSAMDLRFVPALGAAPHPPSGHLLPVNGEKEGKE